jgi:hypothetical protein
MEKSNGKILAICSLGGILGFVIGSQMQSIWWRIALTLVGAFAFYIVYGPKQAWIAAKSSWRSVTTWDARSMCLVAGWGQLAITSLYITAWVGILVPSVAVIHSSTSPTCRNIALFLAAIINGVAIVAECIVIRDSIMARKGYYDSFSYEDIQMYRSVAIHCSAPMVLWHLIRAIPALCRFAKKFFWRFFLLVHSEPRLLVMLSVCVGAIGGAGLRATYLGMHYTVVPLGLAVLCGIIVGLAYGILGNEIVRKRWLIPRGHLQHIS